VRRSRLHRAIRLAQNRMENDSWDDEGSVVYFIKMRQLGLKLWFEKNDRDFAYDNQKLAAKHRLAPKTHRKIRVPTTSHTYYGYITQLADTERVINSWDARYSEQAYKIEDGLCGIGIDFCDTHAHNFGLIRNHLVCIDFGMESIHCETSY
jgi:hypothetical protein